MTTAADDRAVEEAFEASLAGRPVPGAAAGLAAFTSAVRGTATQPGRPNAALAELLSTGLLTDQSSPSTRTAPAAGPLPSRRTRSRTRRRFTVIVPALIAKFLSAGAVAQAATGAGVVVVVVTGAGATGTLPEGPQETFDNLVGTTETVEEPAPDITDTDGEDVAGEEPEMTDPAAPPVLSEEEGEEETVVELTDADAAEAWAEAATGITTQKAFKEWMAVGKAKGWVNGQAVREAVHARNAARKADRETDETEVDETEVEETEVEDTDENETEVESSDDDGDDDRKGKGKGKGRGGRD